jgi:hypothetical protein
MSLTIHFFTSRLFKARALKTSKYLWLKLFVIFSLVLLVATTSLATKKYSQASGNWTTGSTWVGGVVPVANDTVFILPQHNISISNANLYSNSTYMFLIVMGTLDLHDNGKLSFNSSSKVIIETGGKIIGDGSSDQISMGGGPSEYSGSQGTVTGPAYVSNGHSPSSGEGTSGCGCYNGIGVTSCAITSSDGYTVNILVWARKILVETSPCTSGYNYDVRMDYSVQFSGSNIPAGGLYTLQGNIFCGSSSLFFDLPNTGGIGTVDSQGNAWRSASDCATATPTSLGCLSAGVDISGPGIAYQTCSTSLPIELMSFEANQCDEAVCLEWSTASEENFDKFIIERSSDGLQYDSIGFMLGSGNSKLQLTYSFQDQFPTLGKNYYRLRSVDYDLTSEYSEPVLAQFAGAKNVVVYPNPVVASSIQLRTNFRPNEGDRVEIFDNLGLKVQEYKITGIESILTFSRSLKPGSYLLRYTSDNYSQVIRFTSN